MRMHFSIVGALVCALVMAFGCVPPQQTATQQPQPQPTYSEAGGETGEGGDGYGSEYGDYSSAGDGGAPVEQGTGERCRSTEHFNDCPTNQSCCVNDQALQTYGCSRTCYWP